MVIKLVDHPDGSSDVYVQTAMSYPAVLQLLTQAVLGDFAATHEEENSDE